MCLSSHHKSDIKNQKLSLLVDWLSLLAWHPGTIHAGGEPAMWIREISFNLEVHIQEVSAAVDGVRLCHLKAIIEWDLKETNPNILKMLISKRSASCQCLTGPNQACFIKRIPGSLCLVLFTYNRKSTLRLLWIVWSRPDAMFIRIQNKPAQQIETSWNVTHGSSETKPLIARIDGGHMHGICNCLEQGTFHDVRFISSE